MVAFLNVGMDQDIGAKQNVNWGLLKVWWVTRGDIGRVGNFNGGETYEMDNSDGGGRGAQPKLIWILLTWMWKVIVTRQKLKCWKRPKLHSMKVFPLVILHQFY